MKSAGVLGWPVAHSKSPLIHRFWLAKLGLDGDYGRFPVHPDRLADAIRALPALGLAGVNVTVPHKVAALAFLDALDATVEQVGAANCVVVGDDGRLTGWNTDVDGVWEPTAALDLAGSEAILVGAGGAARAALAALRRHAVGHVTVVNRSAERAAELLRAARQSGDVRALGEPLPPAAILVNASSLGMTGQPPLDLDLAALRDGAVVFDAVYAPLDTPLLAAARARGLIAIDGLQMLVAQAAAAFELFFAARAPREHDAELRALLTA